MNDAFYWPLLLMTQECAQIFERETLAYCDAYSEAVIITFVNSVRTCLRFIIFLSNYIYYF